jgi:hypothetical protein
MLSYKSPSFPMLFCFTFTLLILQFVPIASWTVPMTNWLERNSLESAGADDFTLSTSCARIASIELCEVQLH